MEETLKPVSKNRSRFDKALFVLLLGITFLVPIFFIPATFISPQFSTSLLFASGVIIAIAVYVVLGLVYGSLELPKKGRYVALALFIVPVVYVLAGIANGFNRAPFFGYTFDINTVGFVVLSFVYLFFVSLSFRNKKYILYSYVMFVVSSLLLSLFLLARLTFGPEVFSFGIFTDITRTPLGSWNNAGTFFGIAAILSFMTYHMLRLSKFMKILLTIALVCSMFFLALVNFKVLWIVLGLSALVFVLYVVFSSKKEESVAASSIKHKLKRIPFFPFIVFAISLIFVIWGDTLGSSIYSRFQINNLDVRPTFSTTVSIATNTLREKPLFGSGPNAFVAEWLKWKPDEVTTSVFWNTDFTSGIGLIPTFAVTTGFIGILSWLVFFGFFIYLGIKHIFVRNDDVFTHYLVTSSFFVSLYLWIMAFVYIPSTAIFILTFFFTGLFFASVCLSGEIEVGMKKFSKTPREGFFFSLVMILFLIFALALGNGLFKNSQSLWYFQKSSYALNTTKDILLSEEYMLKAIDAVPYDVFYRSLSDIELLKLNAILNTDTKSVKIQEIQKQFQNTLSNAIAAAMKAKEADDTNYLNWVALGKVYETVSIPQLKVELAFESSEMAYNEALRRNPKNPGIFLFLARLSATVGNFKKARLYALQAITIKKNYLDAYFLLSQIEVADNNLKGAIDSVTAASIIDPTNPATFFQLGLLKYNGKDYRGAIDAFEKAISIAPDYANAKYFLGLSYDMTGEKSKALQQFIEIKLTNQSNAELDTIIENLKAGRGALSNAGAVKPEMSNKLPVKEKNG